MTIDRTQAQMLATLACAARPHGARRWDAAGVMAAIGHVRHLDLATVGVVVLVAAADRDLETPGAIANTASPTWRRATQPIAVPSRSLDHTPASLLCGICSEPEDRCRARWADDHTYEPAHRQRAAAAALDPLDIDDHVNRIKHALTSRKTS